jgi:hypothetical protein
MAVRAHTSCYQHVNVFAILLLVLQASHSSGQTKKSRCLLVSIDNRNLNTNLEANDYVSMNAVITLAYAKKHNYDYLYIENGAEGLYEKVIGKYPDVANQKEASDARANVAKDVATAYHVGLKQFRAASWAKLPPLWYITTESIKNLLTATKETDTKPAVGQYDYIWYIDSDATVSPLHMNQSIDDAVLDWESNRKVTRGSPTVSASAFIFFNNHPWRDDMPCAGSFLFRPQLAEHILREWWDYNLPTKNFKHFHEQDALWHMIESEASPVSSSSSSSLPTSASSSPPAAGLLSSPSTHPQTGERLVKPGSHMIVTETTATTAYSSDSTSGDTQTERGPESRSGSGSGSHIIMTHTANTTAYSSGEGVVQLTGGGVRRLAVDDGPFLFKLNSASYTIVTERQFPSAWKRYEELWLCHVASYNYLVRMPILYHFLQTLGLDNDQAFSTAIEEVKSKHILRINALQVTEDMEALSSRDLLRVTRFPIHSEETQSQWYDAHVTSAEQPTLPLPLLHEGRLIRKKGEFWYVRNGLRHGFQNFDAFLSLGFNNQRGFPVNSNELSQIPEGPLLHKQSLALAQVAAPAPAAAACVVDVEFEAIVNSNGTRAKLYLISHDDASFKLGRKFANCKGSWVEPVMIRSTAFFESTIYRDVFPPLFAQWDQLDYVITGTYKTVAKQLHYNGFTQSLDQIKQLLQVARDGDYDVLPFLRSGSGTMSFCLYFHGPGFKLAWDALLLELGYSVTTIRSLDEAKPFYRNIFIMKPVVLKQLSEFMARAMDVVTNNEKVRSLFQQNSNYKEGSAEVATRIFGTSYYQMHPFIFERLPSFFIRAHHFKMCHGPNDKDGPCKWNS